MPPNVGRSAEECLAFFAQAQILDHYKRFAVGQSPDVNLLDHIECVPGLADSLRMMSKEGKVAALMERAAAGLPEPECEVLGKAWMAISMRDSRNFRAIVAASGGRWLSYTALQKQKILAIARMPGSARPNNHNSKLGKALNNYILESRSCDREFRSLLQQSRPDWFQKVTINRIERKQAYIEGRKAVLLRYTNMASSSRPALSSHERLSITHYCYPGPQYDAKLSARLRRDAPEWFR